MWRSVLLFLALGVMPLISGCSWYNAFCQRFTPSTAGQADKQSRDKAQAAEPD